MKGYVTDIITDMCLEWLGRRDRGRPFCLLYHHKAPHRSWYPDEKHMSMYSDVEIPEPATLYDDYANRSHAASAATMRVGVHMRDGDLKARI
ncbi:MAG: sulfatase, partial [Acidobacteriota bacterium]